MAPENDQRSAERRTRDEEIATELPLPPLDLPANAERTSVELHLADLRNRTVTSE